MAVTATARIIEKLLERFEALRGKGKFEVVLIEAEPGSKMTGDIPPKYRDKKPYFNISAALAALPNSQAPTFTLNWQRSEEELAELRACARAAGYSLASNLLEAGLVDTAKIDLSGRVEEGVTEFLWARALAELSEEQLRLVGARPTRWHHWQKEGIGSFDVRMVARAKASSEDQRTKDSFLAAVYDIDTSARYVVIEDVLELSISLLQLLADGLGKAENTKKAKAVKPRKPYSNHALCVEQYLSTSGGRDFLNSHPTQEEFCKRIREVFPGQPSSKSLLHSKSGWPRSIKWPWGKARRPRAAREVAESRLGEDFDLTTSEARSTSNGSTPTASNWLLCTSCRDRVSLREMVQHGGQPYCEHCGSEKAHGEIRPPQ